MLNLFQLISHQHLGILPGTLDPDSSPFAHYGIMNKQKYPVKNNCLGGPNRQDKCVQFHMTLSSKACSKSRYHSQSPCNEADPAQGRQNSDHEEITFDFSKKVGNSKIF